MKEEGGGGWRQRNKAVNSVMVSVMLMLRSRVMVIITAIVRIKANQITSLEVVGESTNHRPPLGHSRDLEAPWYLVDAHFLISERM